MYADAVARVVLQSSAWITASPFLNESRVSQMLRLIRMRQRCLILDIAATTPRHTISRAHVLQITFRGLCLALTQDISSLSLSLLLSTLLYYPEIMGPTGTPGSPEHIILLSFPRNLLAGFISKTGTNTWNRMILGGGGSLPAHRRARSEAMFRREWTTKRQRNLSCVINIKKKWNISSK